MVPMQKMRTEGGMVVEVHKSSLLPLTSLKKTFFDKKCDLKLSQLKGFPRNHLIGTRMVIKLDLRIWTNSCIVY